MDKKHTIRVRNGFSDRNKIDPISKLIQYDEFSCETRIVLFNNVLRILEHQISSLRLDENRICQCVYENLFNEVYYERYEQFGKMLNEILELFKTETYDKVLTMIEFLCSLVYEKPENYKNRNYHDAFFMSNYYDTYEEMNKCFENEFVGYRFINGLIVKITNKNEIQSIEEAIKTPYDAVNDSISKSILFLSESSKKDYENSIKESVMAIEQLLNVLLKTNGLTMGKAVEQLFTKINVDDNLKIALKSIYKYASDSNGIRHGNNKEKKKISFNEAKYILILSCSTINFLIGLDI